MLLSGCASGGYARSGEVARPAGARCAWRVCVTTSESSFGRSYRIENAEPVPVTVVLQFKSLLNASSMEGDKVERVVEPRSTEIVRLDRIGRGRISTDLEIAIDLGSSATHADDWEYAVPFADTVPHRIIQSFDGGETHVGSMRFAIDIEMPEGTPVLAAREGVVLYLQDGFTEGGADPSLIEKANMVVIAHSDGSMASYGHLAPGITVKVGDRVAVGQRVGLSGGTGFAATPHLHFHVGVRMLGEPGRTIRFQMLDGAGYRVGLGRGAEIPPGRERVGGAPR